MANHAGELVVVNVVKSLWKEFQDRNWKEFEEYEIYKRDHIKYDKYNARHHHGSKFKLKKPFMEFLNDKKSNHTTTFLASEDVVVSSPMAPKLSEMGENSNKVLV